MTKTQELRDFIHRFFELANQHDFDRMVEFVHQEVIVNGSPVARPDLIAVFHHYSAAVPGIAGLVR